VRHRIGAVLGAWLLTLTFAAVAGADGSVPPQPYRYLHPPPALAPNNNLPEGGSGTISTSSGQSNASDIFSRDGQAGILAPQGAFSLSSTVRSIVVRIEPINTPPNLPASYVADGNAVRITATGRPGGTILSLHKPATLVLRWPRLPSGVEIYRHGVWRQVCAPQHAVLTPSTFTCPVTELGVFLVVRASSASAVKTPQSRFAFLGRLIPIIIVALVVVVALVLGYVLFRRGSRA
jgi:hypothetical protein